MQDLSKCSFFNTRTKQQGKLPLSQQINQYCLSGTNDTILNFTKKDLIYLNELIATNRAPDTVHAEKNITAPQEIQPNPTFCPDQTKTIFWPNVTNTQDMCQEENVVAIARVKEGGKEGTFWYVINGEVQKAIISDDGLRLNRAMQGVLNGTKIQKIDPNPFGRQTKDIITIGNEGFPYSADMQHSNSYNNKLITFPDRVNTITF